MSQLTIITLDEKSLTSELDRAGYKKMGITVKTAVTYEDVIKNLSDFNIDMIVMNMDHTKVNAIQATKKLKKIPEFANIPVVLTSVQSSAKTRQSAKDCGADLFVEQPLPRDYFIEKLKNLLSKQTRGQQRVSGSINVTFQWEGKSHTCEVGDLSLTGLLLSTKLSIPAGHAIEMQINLGASNKPVRVKGEVVRQVGPDKRRVGAEDGGIGIRFNQFSGDGQMRIESWVARTSDSTNKMAYYL